MRSDYNFKQFLLDLDKQKHKTIYARITALNLAEHPIETIEGRVTAGSINLDGASAVRRTCSLTMIADDFDYNDYYWGLNTKFKLEIGVLNTINSAFDDIIWFKQGTYLISSFNTSNTTTNFTISLQGKDKMCQLNGEVGGSLTSSVDFGTEEIVDKNGIIKIRKIPIQDVIRHVVHTYAGEPLHNIIINDLDGYGLELLEYRYDMPMYLYRKVDSQYFDNVTLDGNKKGKVAKTGETKPLSSIENKYFDMLIETLTNDQDPSIITIDGGNYYVAKVSYGQTAGYRSTDLVYPGDLIGNVGDPVTSILDKIKNMLGEFEYFYDVDGRFTFQKKQAFVNTIWTPDSENNQKENADYEQSLANASTYAYTFSEGELITAFNNNPNLLNVKNDYAIWGQRSGVSGTAIPIHLRYAIDKKPVEYHTIEVTDAEVEDYNKKYGTSLTGQKSDRYTADKYDWREIIYQMAKDYYKYNFLEDFELKIIEANGDLYPTGQTGYEAYYIDLQSFWRELYWPTYDEEKLEIITKINNESDLTKKSDLQDQLKLLNEKWEGYYSNGDNQYWNKQVYESPELLSFWFDFLDIEGELSQYSVKNIGVRPKAINDTNIKSIYFREIPDVIFVKDITEEEKISGYKYIQIGSRENMFSISSQGKSAKDTLDELIYQHGYCTESATITCIPIYYLQTNTRIYIHDDKTNLDGDYIVSKITIPLTYNGTMSITATKAAETIL